MIKDLVAKIIDGKIIYEPKKRRGQSRGVFLANVHAANRLNGVKNTSSCEPKKSAPRQLKMFDFDSKVE